MNYRERLVKQYYTTHYRHFLPKTAKEWERVIDRIGLNFGKFFDAIPRDSLILDVACGVGYLEHYLLRKGFTRIHAIDLSEEQIRVAKDKLQEYGFDYTNKVEFHLGNVFEYLKRKSGYAVISMIDFLDHLEKDKVIEILNLCNDALQSEGFLFVRVTNADNLMWGSYFYRDFTHETPFTKNTLQQCLSLTGFEPLKIDYELILTIKMAKLNPIVYFKNSIQWIGRWLLGKFIGISPGAFIEDLIAVGKKQ